MKNFIVITGPAGCGLSSAEYVFEELGYFVIKNIPSESVNVVIDNLLSKENKIKNICFVSHAIEAKATIETIKKRKDANEQADLIKANKGRYRERYLPVHMENKFRGVFKSGLGTILNKDGSPDCDNLADAQKMMDQEMAEARQRYAGNRRVKSGVKELKARHRELKAAGETHRIMRSARKNAKGIDQFAGSARKYLEDRRDGILNSQGKPMVHRKKKEATPDVQEIAQAAAEAAVEAVAEAQPQIVEQAAAPATGKMTRERAREILGYDIGKRTKEDGKSEYVNEKQLLARARLAVKNGKTTNRRYGRRRYY